MPASTPWKHAVTGGVGIVAGVALLSVDWGLAPLAAFVGLALVARGALHLVASTPFVGFAGAFAIFDLAGDVAVGITVLAWPGPTTLVLGVLVGSWAVARAFAGATIAITNRVEHPRWEPKVAFAAVTGVLGAVLVARTGGTVHGTVVLIGVLALLEGARDVVEAAWQARHADGRRRVGQARSAPAA